MLDRRVHAVLESGAEVVRYDRAGKWYIEWPDGAMKPRRRLNLSKAVWHATSPGAVVNYGVPGGQAFDSQVRKTYVKRERTKDG